MTEHDREAILKRRAFYVTSTLAAISGCATATPTSGSTGSTAQGGPVASVEPAKPIATATTTTAATAPQATATAAPTPSFAAPDGMPPLETPANLNETAKGRYEQLRQHVPAVHRALDDIAVNEPKSCDFADDACRAAWEETAKRWGAFEAAHRSYAIRCLHSGKSDEAKVFISLYQNHNAFIAKRKTELRERQDQRLEASKDGATAYAAMERQHTRPQVCLKFSCPDW